MDEEFKSIIYSIAVMGLIFLVVILGIFLPIDMSIEKSKQKERELELEKYRIEMEYKYKYNEVEE